MHGVLPCLLNFVFIFMLHELCYFTLGILYWQK